MGNSTESFLHVQLTALYLQTSNVIKCTTSFKPSIGNNQWQLRLYFLRSVLLTAVNTSSTIQHMALDNCTSHVRYTADDGFGTSGIWLLPAKTTTALLCINPLNRNIIKTVMHYVPRTYVTMAKWLTISTVKINISHSHRLRNVLFIFSRSFPWLHYADRNLPRFFPWFFLSWCFTGCGDSVGFYIQHFCHWLLHNSFILKLICTHTHTHTHYASRISNHTFLYSHTHIYCTKTPLEHSANFLSYWLDLSLVAPCRPKATDYHQSVLCCHLQLHLLPAVLQTCCTHFFLQISFLHVLWSSSTSMALWCPLYCLSGNAVIGSSQCVSNLVPSLLLSSVSTGFWSVVSVTLY